MILLLAVFLPLAVVSFFAIARLSRTLALIFLAIASFAFYAQTNVANLVLRTFRTLGVLV